MRENRTYGSEGGEAKAFPTPICVREDALSAGCKSLPQAVTPCVDEGNCVAQSGVESNRRRKDSP